MKELIFRTRAQANPNGKMKVYFCHHPEDFDDHFSRICGDILAVNSHSLAKFHNIGRCEKAYAIALGAQNAIQHRAE